MKITKQRLKQIIKEELGGVLKHKSLSPSKVLGLHNISDSAALISAVEKLIAQGGITETNSRAIEGWLRNADRGESDRGLKDQLKSLRDTVLKAAGRVYYDPRADPTRPGEARPESTFKKKTDYQAARKRRHGTYEPSEVTELVKSQLKNMIKEELGRVLNEGGAVGHSPGINDLRRDISNVASYINAWFNARAQGNTGFRGTNLSDYLRKGAKGEAWGKYSGRVSFKKALSEVAPENAEEFKKLFLKLADGIEQDPSLLDSKKIGKKGDWYAVAKSL